MRRMWTLAAGRWVYALRSPHPPASRRPMNPAESAQATINRLQDEGYTVNIDKIGTAPMNKCVVTNVRNPQQVTQWVPYIGPGRDNGDRSLVLKVMSQSISVTLDCSRN